jgi:hypothetical protein
MGQDGEVSNDQGGEVNPAAAGGVTFVSVEFEVYGHVQGIYLYSYNTRNFLKLITPSVNGSYVNIQHLTPRLRYSRPPRPRLRWC